MQAVSRRALLRCAVGVGAVAAGSLLKSPAVLAQAAPIKLKFGNDLPATHSVNVRLKEAIDAIAADTNGRVAISLFPNNQLGGDTVWALPYWSTTIPSTSSMGDATGCRSSIR